MFRRGPSPDRPDPPTPRGRPVTTTYVKLACPNCKQPLRIRTEYLGQRLACKHCKRTFLPVAVDGAVPAAPPGPDPALERANQRITQLEAELRQAQGAAEGRAADLAR